MFYVSRMAVFALALFLLLWGIAHATNLKVVWMEPITALAALVAGILFMFEFFLGKGNQ